MRRSYRSLVTLLVVLAFEGAASASPNYPSIIERYTGVECPRPLTRCLICHDTAAGGEETANKPFAETLRGLGLSGGKAPRELAAALEDLPDDQDTDADGTPDQEELSACMNPSGGELSEGPGYGCNGAHLVRATPSLDAAWAVGGLLGLSCLLRSRRRRKHTPELGVLVVSLIALDSLPGCSPTEILEESYPAKVRTCYEFPVQTDGGVSPQSSFYAGTVRAEGCDEASAGGGGNAGTGSVGASSGGTSGRGGASSGAGGSSASSAGMGGAPAAANGGTGGTGAASGSGGTSVVAPGDAGPGDPPAEGQGGSGPSLPPLSEACRTLAEARSFVDVSDDTAVMLQLFKSPFSVGGCQDPENGQCHEPGGNQPNLREGDVLARLLDGHTDPLPGEYKCAALLPEERFWITRGAGLAGSLIWRKVSSAPPDAPFLELPAPPCGDSMPAFPGDPSFLSESDRQCIADWIVRVSGSGGPG